MVSKKSLAVTYVIQNSFDLLRGIAAEKDRTVCGRSRTTHLLYGKSAPSYVLMLYDGDP
jgi:hypothetical protein